MDKGKKDALWYQIGEKIRRTGPDVRQWFQTQWTRYGKLTADMRKSGSGTSKKFMMTERAKWVLHHFQFLDGHIIRRASTEIAGFSCSSANVRSPDESRGSGTTTDAESTMDTRSQGLSQQPSFSSATASTHPHSRKTQRCSSPLRPCALTS